MADAEELGRRYFKAVEDGDVEAAMGTLADDVRFWTPSGGFEGKENARGFIQGYVEGFPGARFDITGVIGSGNAVAFEGSYAGTNSGPMRTPDGQEMPPTGRNIAIPFVTLFDADGEHLTSHRAYWDQMGFMGQLGLMPGPGE
jgi:predicted ester cyclase